MYNKVLAVIVTYKPDKELLTKNINALQGRVEGILIWENSPEIDIRSWLNSTGIIYQGVGRNVGISRALNFAYRYAKEQNYSHMLTLDQDSCFKHFSEFRDTSFQLDKENLYVFGPMVAQDAGVEIHNDIVPISIENYLITSGMLVPLTVIERVGGYNEDFMVDAVDLDFNLRVMREGITIFRNKNGVLIQHFGDPIVRTLFKKTYICSNYNPFRLYGIFRNHIILYRETKNDFVKNQVGLYLRHFLPRIILWENNKYKKLIAILKGIIDGLKYKN